MNETAGGGPERGFDEPAIRITDLRKRYGDFELKDVSFSLPRGYVMGLVGPNGAGSSSSAWVTGPGRKR